MGTTMARDDFAVWWQQTAAQPGVKYVDVLTWANEMVKRQGRRGPKLATPGRKPKVPNARG
jgi:hypothetical protein